MDRNERGAVKLLILVKFQQFPEMWSAPFDQYFFLVSLRLSSVNLEDGL
jgi:hypothetical protein